MKKRLLAVALTGVIGASMVIPAMAADEVTSGGVKPVSAGSTDIIAGVVVDDEDMKLKVEVPTTFAFVVNGTVDSSKKTQAVTRENDGLLLPNIKVKVDKPSEGSTQGEYHLEAGETENWKFTNYSTKLSDPSDTSSARQGLDVYVWGEIANEGTPQSRNYWTNVASVTDDDADFKKYALSVTSDAVVTDETSAPTATAKEEVVFSKGTEDGNLAMAKKIYIPAPDVTAGIDETTGYALIGSEVGAEFDVKVGGKRGNYTQIENSAKVGTVIWTIATPKITAPTGTKTAPNENYQSEATPTT